MLKVQRYLSGLSYVILYSTMTANKIQYGSIQASRFHCCTRLPLQCIITNTMTTSRNLWEDAALCLRPKDKTSLAISSPFPGLDDLLSTIDDTKQDFQRKQWRVHVGAKKEAIILRDVFSKIAAWVQKFVDVGDVATQYDPGHAALPWACIRFLLKASISNFEKAKIVMEGIECVSNLIVWCNIQEQLYLRRSSSATNRLHQALIKLYIAILRFLAKVIRFYSKSTAGGFSLKLLQSPDRPLCFHLEQLF